MWQTSAPFGSGGRWAGGSTLGGGRRRRKKKEEEVMVMVVSAMCDVCVVVVGEMDRSKFWT